MKATVTLFDEVFNISLEVNSYRDGNRVAITAVCDDGERFGTVTVNDPSVDLAEGEILVKTWTENAWVPQLLEQLPNRFFDTGKRVPMGYDNAQVWRFVPSWESQVDVESKGACRGCGCDMVVLENGLAHHLDREGDSKEADHEAVLDDREPIGLGLGKGD
jgi:hypothetical protein